MKKLLKAISPLAPDDSGACSVFYELGGITVICDAGGCTGNICGFDEPRWHEKKSALFSAGLRDMDAILGRDDRLVAKLALACGQIAPRFTAVIGTPVPSVIATDFHALRHLCEKKTGLPCVTVETTGASLYDKGASMAYLELFRTFAKERSAVERGRVGVLGATPLDTGLTHAEPLLKRLRSMGYETPFCFGLDSGLDDVIAASACEKLLVVAPSGLAAAKHLHEKFGTPYEICCPQLPAYVCEEADALRRKKVLIVHTQTAANALRERLSDCECVCATWFLFDRKLAQERDFHIDGEDTFLSRVREDGYDAIIADRDFRRLLPDFAGAWIDFPHYAVSARTEVL